MTSAGRDAWITLLKDVELDQYHIGDYIGSGQFSLVFEAQEITSGKKVALKVMLPGAKADDVFEFRREAELLSALRTALNVVPLIQSSSGTIEVTGPGGTQVPLPLHFHAFELADGSLEDLLARRDEIDLSEKLSYWRGAVRGIHQMHQKQMAHRDLKSSNSLIFPRVEIKERCKISDLGRAVDMSQPPNFEPSDYLVGRGDFRFAPPECLFAQASRDSNACKLVDLYGLGSLLFELVTGQGITSLALGYGPAVVRSALAQAAAGRRMDLSALRGQYTEAYLLFESLMPSVIKNQASKLLKQLCSPVPEDRVPMQRSGNRYIVATDLQWLIRNADILIKGTSISKRTSYRRRRGNG